MTDNYLRGRIVGLEREITLLRRRLAADGTENDRLRQHNADLEARLDRVEAHLGFDDSAAILGVPDD